MTSSRPQKSTNVRPAALTVFAAAVKAVAIVHPGLAAQMMLTAFCTPPKKKLQDLDWTQGLEPEREFLDVDGTQIAVYRWGPALNGKKVLLAHGWAGRSEQLRNLVEPLRAKGFAVYAFDHAAHGRSGGKTSNLPRFARTLTAVAKHVGRVYAVVAHSLGSPAAAYALTHGLAADRFVMIAPPAHPRRYISGFWRMLGIADALGEQMNARIEKTEGMRLRDLDLSQIAQSLTLPTLVIHDRTDREVPFIEGEEWSRSVVDGQLLTTEGLGHNRLLAAPLVTEAVARFLDGERITPNVRATSSTPAPSRSSRTEAAQPS